ncbi:unnamed protein product [Effrenium voratum]|nr:unnamed protein product [Effrenium voratum]
MRQGSANVAALLQSLSLKGSLSLRQTLPMRRKRDLLQLPVADLHFNCALCLEEDTSFMDDGNATVRFQDVQCSAQGRLWSEGEESLLAKASVSTSGVLAAAVRAASLVQALIEAETAAARLSGARSADVFAARSARETGDEDVQYTSVRVGDVLQVEVGGSANAEALAQLRLSFRNKEETVCSPVSRGRVEADKLTVADMDLDDAYAVEGDDRMPLLRLSIAGSEASIQMGECRAQVGDLALTVPSAKMKLDCVEAEINAEGIGLELRGSLSGSQPSNWPDSSASDLVWARASGLGSKAGNRLDWDRWNRLDWDRWKVFETAANERRKILFPQPPAATSTLAKLASYSMMSLGLSLPDSPDARPDAVACGNKLLDDEVVWPSEKLMGIMQLARILRGRILVATAVACIFLLTHVAAEELWMEDGGPQLSAFAQFLNSTLSVTETSLIWLGLCIPGVLGMVMKGKASGCYLRWASGQLPLTTAILTAGLTFSWTLFVPYGFAVTDDMPIQVGQASYFHFAAWCLAWLVWDVVFATLLFTCVGPATPETKPQKEAEPEVNFSPIC